MFIAMGGITILGVSLEGEQLIRRYVASYGLAKFVCILRAGDDDGDCLRLHIAQNFAQDWTPNSDTLNLCQTLTLDSRNKPLDLEKEILVAMLLGPISFIYPTLDELMAAVSIRRNIVEAARKTRLAFDTAEAERPAEFFSYTQGRGFHLLPGKSLIDALVRATQSDESGRLYSFSCYRASEYVILLAIAQELQKRNPMLLDRLQKQWESSAIVSGQFHEAFLRENGSTTEPLPLCYYVPGDRVWFRNPDLHSSDVTGYEGSWVFYLGDGLFNNFWKKDQPFTVKSKCLELYHWRNGVYRDSTGELKMDEAIVEDNVRNSLANAEERENILSAMMLPRAPRGVYEIGGCIDASREFPRWICPGTSDISLPAMVR